MLVRFQRLCYLLCTLLAYSVVPNKELFDLGLAHGFYQTHYSIIRYLVAAHVQAFYIRSAVLFQ